MSLSLYVKHHGLGKRVCAFSTGIQEMVEDTKRVSTRRKSKKDRQCNDQMKNDKRINDFEQHEPTMNPDVNSCTSERNEVLAPLMAPVKVVTRLSCSFLVSVLKTNC